jgi:predicted PurR-regulated permease PerM
MKELKELIEKILVTLVKQKIRNYVIYGCSMFLLETIAIAIVLLIVIFTSIWGINTFLKNVANPKGAAKTTIEKTFKNALEKPKKIDDSRENAQQEILQHKQANTEENAIKCIGSGCNKPKRGTIKIKESE